jgi:hypothetical protein
VVLVTETQTVDLAHWNYRLTVQTVDDTEVWEVREIYYDASGNVASWTKEPVTASGETWLECSDDLSRMSGVIGLPAFDLDTKQWVNHKRKPVSL